jgi:hypothetical protein
MQCFVYKGSKKEGLYLYLATRDDFSAVPQPLLDRFGALEFALEFELNENRKLSRENPAEVMKNLTEHGFHLQMPETQKSLLAEMRRHNQVGS